MRSYIHSIHKNTHRNIHANSEVHTVTCTNKHIYTYTHIEGYGEQFLFS